MIMSIVQMDKQRTCEAGRPDASSFQGFRTQPSTEKFIAGKQSVSLVWLRWILNFPHSKSYRSKWLSWKQA